MPRIDLGSGPDFGKALRIALCQRGVQNHLRGLHTNVSLTGWNARLHNWVMVGYGFEDGEYCRRRVDYTNAGVDPGSNLGCYPPPIDSHPPASAGCDHPRDPILHAVLLFQSFFDASVKDL